MVVPITRGGFVVIDNDTEIVPGILERTRALLPSGHVEIDSLTIGDLTVCAEKPCTTS